MDLFWKGNFIGEFLDFDGKDLSRGYTGVMRVRVRIDVRKPLKRKKRITLPNGSLTYVTFAYEKLTLFCFLCGKLGHVESFCPNRILQENQNLVLGWNISLRAPTKRGSVLSSVWLRKEGSSVVNYG